MNTFKSSDLSHKRAEVLKAARDGGVIIEERRSNGEVICEYVIAKACERIQLPVVDDNGKESVVYAVVIGKSNG